MDDVPRTPSGLPRYPSTLKKSRAGADPAFRKAVGRSIRHYRKAAGLKASALAETLQTSEQTISAWECGVSFPTLPHLHHAAAFLGVPASTILRRAEAIHRLDQTMREQGKLLASQPVNDTDV